MENLILHLEAVHAPAYTQQVVIVPSCVICVMLVWKGREKKNEKTKTQKETEIKALCHIHARISLFTLNHWIDKTT